jgi:hypothetical protein
MLPRGTKLFIHVYESKTLKKSGWDKFFGNKFDLLNGQYFKTF